MQTRMKNNSKGITLIALVVTIVVLLILAGIAMARVRSKNGIKTRLKEAKSSTEVAEVLEKVKFAERTGKNKRIRKS